MIIKLIFFLLSLTIMAINAYCGVMPSQSRIIYHEEDKEQSLMLANTNEYPVIVQTWIDRGEGNPETANIPFISIPPVFQMEPSDIKGVRVIYNRDKLPSDKESLFWFNIYEIPPEKKESNPENSVLITMNTQIKLFFRPKIINVTPEESVGRITCNKINKTSIECYNPSLIYLSVINLKIMTDDNKIKEVSGNDLILPPLSNKKLTIDAMHGSIKKMIVMYVNDNGEILEQTLSNR
ncbi:fimbrial biogenesis chaperone [Morganella morganii]|uniref:fimbrial biogenesis chaperone n=1 Tax=Morganella morganii TaxID=582 RepID=UPI0021D3139D|nr:molecular chaperone [Morganella morganii]MCU6225555.1 molecular chaperone [Morganella morganii]MCU6234378.1 molecular chaperone [Morganella morganii]MCU6275830.1 molecular chaperone [Morganella morganii]